MLNSFRWICLFLVFVLVPVEALAQETALDQSGEDVSFRVTGGLQPRISYGFEEGAEANSDRVGFGLRRGRIDATVTVGDHMGINYDMDFGRGTLNTVDLFGFYRLNDNLRFRVGFFAHAQPRAYVLTSFVRLDGLERSAIAERWARATTGSSGRDFGVDVTFDAPSTTFIFGIHNGDGNFSTGNYRQSVSRLNGEAGLGIGALAYSLYINHDLLPGVEVGGFARFNGARNNNTAVSTDGPGRDYVSWSSHLYWGANPGSQPFRLKLDVIGLHYEAIGATAQENRVGFALTGAVRFLRFGELYARLEHADELRDKQFFATGISYSLSARKGLPYYRHRITLGYQGGFQDSIGGNDQHLIVLQSQVVF